MGSIVKAEMQPIGLKNIAKFSTSLIPKLLYYPEDKFHDIPLHVFVSITQIMSRSFWKEFQHQRVWEPKITFKTYQKYQITSHSCSMLIINHLAILLEPSKHNIHFRKENFFHVIKRHSKCNVSS